MSLQYKTIAKAAKVEREAIVSNSRLSVARICQTQLAIVILIDFARLWLDLTFPLEPPIARSKARSHCFKSSDRLFA
ncbi:hypothetical protein [Thalassoporum mexicanum]|uniref:hypothetical protein n=1 Tax=Thalassoporum mexicanum TaxID=3457544 RepID=UPI00030291EA|nr:hypothetical protein [Pseudanabaena sp. PCC 7367]